MLKLIYVFITEHGPFVCLLVCCLPFILALKACNGTERLTGILLIRMVSIFIK